MWTWICIAAAIAGNPVWIDHVGTTSIDGSAVDQNGVSFSVTGLSGLVWAGENTYLAVMDNSNHVVILEAEYDGRGLDVDTVGGLSFDRDGDYEDIALNADGDILLFDEGTQQIVRFDAAIGTLIDTVNLPAIYSQHRGNLGCESFDQMDGGEVWIANEEALIPDGPRATPDNGSWVRVLHNDPEGASQQFAYQVDAMPGPYFPFTNDGQSGLIAVVSLPDGTLLAMERSLAFAGIFFETRIYHVTTEGATDVAGLDGLEGAQFMPVTKVLLYVGGHLNLEGLCLGRATGADRVMLLGVVDDGDPLSSNQLVVFELGGLSMCGADINGDGDVGTDDLRAMVSAWGDCPPGGPCDEDLDGSGAVDVNDLLAMVGTWGDCPSSGLCDEDLDGSGAVDANDLLEPLS